MQACNQEITDTLQKYGCELQVAMLVTQAGNYPQITIGLKK